MADARGAGALPPADLPSPLIDCHTHLMPERLFQAVWDYFDEHLWPVRYRGTADMLAETLRQETGATRFVFMNYAHRGGMARDLNRWNAQLAERHPDAIALATFHPDDLYPDRLADEAWRDLRLAGAKLHCQVGRFAPDDRRLYPVYERAVLLDKPIVFHVGQAPQPSEFCGARRFRRLLRDFPDLPAIVAHMGAEEFDAFLDLAEEYPRVYLDTTLVYTDHFPRWRPRVERLVGHQDRILYGSDFPNLPHPARHGIDSIRRLELGAAIEAKIFWQNAARLFDLTLDEGDFPTADEGYAF